MHAVIVTVEIDPARGEEAEEELHGTVVPQVKQAPGFLSGTWLRTADGTRGHGVVLLESEDAAEAVARRAEEGAPPPGGPVSFVSAEVLRVVTQA